MLYYYHIIKSYSYEVQIKHMFIGHEFQTGIYFMKVLQEVGNNLFIATL